MEDYVRDVRKGIEYLRGEFAKLGITVPETRTNFLFAKLPQELDSERIVNLLKEKRFYINGPFSMSPVKGFIRITVGPVEQMRKFISVFKPIYNKARELSRYA